MNGDFTANPPNENEEPHRAVRVTRLVLQGLGALFLLAGFGSMCAGPPSGSDDRRLGCDDVQVTVSTTGFSSVTYDCDEE